MAELLLWRPTLTPEQKLNVLFLVGSYSLELRWMSGKDTSLEFALLKQLSDLLNFLGVAT